MLLAVLAIGAAPPPVAAPAPAAGAAIVVTGRVTSPKVVRTVIRQVGRRSDTGGDDYQIARWLDAVCPVVLGLSDGEAQALVRDVKAIAAEAGAPVGGAGCQKNIEVVVTSDPRAALLDEQKRQPRFYQGIARADVTTMIEGTAPVRWGSAIKTYGADGMPMQRDGSVLDFDGASRLRAATQTGLGRMIVVVDRDKVSAMPVVTRNSLVAFVALAQVNPEAAPRQPRSILEANGSDSLFGEGLQPFDRAYLKALYSVAPDQHGGAQQLAMARKVELLLHR